MAPTASTAQLSYRQTTMQFTRLSAGCAGVFTGSVSDCAAAAAPAAGDELGSSFSSSDSCSAAGYRR